MSNIFLQDPMIALELIAILFSICYLAKLSFLDSDYKPRSLRSDNLLKLFRVGTFISIPKKSLPTQTQLRLLSPSY